MREVVQVHDRILTMLRTASSAPRQKFRNDPNNNYWATENRRDNTGAGLRQKLERVEPVRIW